MQPGTKVAVSCIGDSGLAMYDNQRGLHSMQPILALTAGLEDTQWLSRPGGRLLHIAGMLETELVHRGAGPEAYLVHALVTCPDNVPGGREILRDPAFSQVTQQHLR